MESDWLLFPLCITPSTALQVGTELECFLLCQSEEEATVIPLPLCLSVCMWSVRHALASDNPGGLDCSVKEVSDAMAFIE